MASYGYVHRRNQTAWDGERAEMGKAWSRIRIFFPTASYMYVVEQGATPCYVAVCDVGGAMGVFIGVSAISFIQLLAYSLYLCYVVVEKRLSPPPLFLEVSVDSKIKGAPKILVTPPATLEK